MQRDQSAEINFDNQEAKETYKWLDHRFTISLNHPLR